MQEKINLELFKEMALCAIDDILKISIQDTFNAGYVWGIGNKILARRLINQVHINTYSFQKLIMDINEENLLNGDDQ